MTAFLFFFSCQVLAEGSKPEIRVNDSSDPNGPYSIKMIELALAHIDNKYTLKVTKEQYSQSKILSEIQEKRLDVFWSSSNSEIENLYTPIRIPLYKGILGNRIFIINKFSQDKFDKIKTFDDLKKITIGQGRTWADVKILEHNGLSVVKVNKYESLFYMVDGGRFDAFARGIHEPYAELESHPNLKDLTVEKSIMLVYKMPFYLFVDKNNKQLAKDLELGLNRAISDGTFDKVFFSDPLVKAALEKADMKNRKIFTLENPTLSKETPLDREELWYNPNKPTPPTN